MTLNKGGRLPGLIDYQFILYDNKEYVVGTLKFKNEDKQFIFDKEDFEKVNKRAWHFASGAYISSAYIDDSKRKEIYLHNLIMNNLEFNGKGTKESVDHINRNGLDNRKENLRFISQSEQNLNQNKRLRNIKLPEGCDIKIDDIPRHVWYIKANGLHGDRFGIDLKTENIKWKTSSSKKISLKNKLIEAKIKLEELYLDYPYLNPKDEEKLNERNRLNRSFDEILNSSLHTP